MKVSGTAAGSSETCARTWCVAALPAVQSLAATWNSCCELIENNTIKNSTHNVQSLNISENKRKIEKIADLRTESSQVPSSCVDADMKDNFRPHVPSIKLLPFPLSRPTTPESL